MTVQHPSAAVPCEICKQQKSRDEVVALDSVREAVVDDILAEHPDVSTQGYICLDDLNAYRSKYLEHCLEAEKGDLSAIEAEVVQALQEQVTVSKNTNDEFDRSLTFGQRVADKVAEFGGSWNFIIAFGLIIAAWITINSIALLHKPFDPYPYILLNLMLSCLAALQAPVIMMSQNRQEAKDRLRSEHDYQVNLKSEVEIRNLTEKLDHLLYRQWQRLMEVQRIQTDLMQELSRSVAASKEGNR